MGRGFAVVGAVSALLAVAAGAFGAHGLRGRVSPEMLAVFETGARYQMYHALALVLVGVAGARGVESGLLGAAGWCFVAGTVLFSGSLYGLALTQAPLGIVTPFGGLCFLGGWGLLAVALARG
jgi:uncharacterized membrane protein YgdD (TMEM256/DUF423 family)